MADGTGGVGIAVQLKEQSSRATETTADKPARTQGVDHHNHSPIRAQYLGIKRQHPDAVVLFRLGDFY